MARGDIADSVEMGPGPSCQLLTWEDSLVSTDAHCRDGRIERKSCFRHSGGNETAVVDLIRENGGPGLGQDTEVCLDSVCEKRERIKRRAGPQASSKQEATSTTGRPTDGPACN